MRVPTNNQIYPQVSQPLPHSLLISVVLQLILRSPMDIHDTHVYGSVLQAISKIYLQLLGLNIVHTIRPYGHQTIGTVSGIEQGNLHIINMKNQRILLSARCSIAICSHSRIGRHLTQCALHATFVTIQNMVVRQRKYLKTSIHQGSKKGIWGTKLGIATIGFTRQGCFKINHTHICICQIRTQIAKIRFIVILPIFGIPCPLELYRVLHSIASKEQTNIIARRIFQRKRIMSLRSNILRNKPPKHKATGGK